MTERDPEQEERPERRTIFARWRRFLANLRTLTNGEP